MTTLIVRVAILAALAVPAALAAATPAAAQPPPRSAVDAHSTRTGPRSPWGPVYVDLEDWTAGPTQELGPVPPDGSTSVAWEIQAVNVGRFAVYAVVLPNGAVWAGQGPLVSSAPDLVEVARRRTLSAAGALPVAIAEPVLLGLVTVAVRLRLRRGRCGRCRAGSRLTGPAPA
jgi:hypothetical protein